MRNFFAGAIVFYSAIASAEPQAISFDADHVPLHIVSAMEPNAAWAHTRHADAYLYRIQLESPNGDKPPESVFTAIIPFRQGDIFTLFKPHRPDGRFRGFPWPQDQPLPLPLPAVNTDFSDLWKMGQAAGIRRVYQATLEVNNYSKLPIVAWSMPGDMPDYRDRGIYVDALSGERISVRMLYDPPASDAQIQKAVMQLRAAYGGSGRGNGGGGASSTSADRCTSAGGQMVSGGCLDLYNRRWVSSD